MKLKIIFILSVTILLSTLFFTSCSYISENSSSADNGKLIEQINTLPATNDQTNNMITDASSEYENIRYLNDEEFDIIKEIYKEINFSPEFKKGNTKDYNYYLEQYKKLLEEEVGFWDSKTQKEYYLSEFGELSYDYDKEKYLYYFFDMDEDYTPELCISDGKRFVYIFKYNPSADKFILWRSLDTTWLRLLGSLKEYYQRPGSRDLTNGFMQLDYYGEQEYSLMFFQEEYTDKQNNTSKMVYMVSLPESKNEDNDFSFLKKNKDIIYFRHNNGTPFFKVIEEQYLELTTDYFKAIELAEENIKEVSFTYAELSSAS